MAKRKTESTWMMRRVSGLASLLAVAGPPGRPASGDALWNDVARELLELSHRIVKLLRRRFHTVRDWEELVPNVLARIWQDIGDILAQARRRTSNGPPAAVALYFGNYLLWALKHRVKDELRRQNRRNTESSQVLDAMSDARAEAEASGGHLIADELHKLMRLALETLEARYRDALLTFIDQGNDYPATAAVLGRPEPTVRVYVSRARQMIREFLLNRGWEVQQPRSASRPDRCWNLPAHDGTGGGALPGG